MNNSRKWKFGWAVWLGLSWVLVARAQRDAVASTLRLFQADACAGAGEQVLTRVANTAAFLQHSPPQFVVYAAVPYLIEGWRQVSVDLALKAGTNRGVRAGVNIEQLGQYRKLNLGAGLSMSLSSKFKTGVYLEATTIRVPGYSTGLTAGYRAGCLYTLGSGILLGLDIGHSANNGSSGKSYLPNIFLTQLSYSVSNQLLLLGCWEVEPATSASFRMILRYQPIEKLIFRMGIFPSQPGAALAVGFKWKDLQFVLALGYHSFLGLSPFSMVVWQKSMGAE